ncbi:MAG: glycosyltransferase, partial [Desulfonatronovibrionaceae bacterium]
RCSATRSPGCLAAGLPVVALDAPGVRDVVQDGENGRLLSADSGTEDFARAVAGIYSSPDKTRAMRENARQTARGLTREKCSRSLEALYLRAVENHSREDKKLDLKSWESLQKSLAVEWDLLTQKTNAIINAVYPYSTKESKPGLNEKNN